MTNRKLNLSDRTSILLGLTCHQSLYQIALSIDRSISTVSRELRAHSHLKRSGGGGRSYNACANRFGCRKKFICAHCENVRWKRSCSHCFLCNERCGDFIEQKCDRINHPPYVCNGCPKVMLCTLEKRIYDPEVAQHEAEETRSSSRTGCACSDDELRSISMTVTPLIKQNQSIHHIYSCNKDVLMIDERTLYRYIDQRLLDDVMNLDLPRKVRRRARKCSVHAKLDKKCRIGRTWDDFLIYTEEHPDVPVVQIDSVIGCCGSHKVLLTVHFTKAELMLAFIREANDARSVTEIFNSLYQELGRELYGKLFSLILTDNGSEFSDPHALEYSPDGEQRSHIFYCDPGAPYQKGSAERNHEFIRYCIPKGSSMDGLLQKDICLMMDNINSYSRKSLGDRSPMEVFAYLYGQETLSILGCTPIPPEKITLNSSVFRKGGEDLG